MKNKIINMLIGMGIMGILVGCGQVVNTAQANENGYLKYCGSQDVFDSISGNKKRIEVYEDIEHDKVVYVSVYRGCNVDVAVTDNNSKSK